MKDSLANKANPLDANLEKVIPGLFDWQKANQQALQALDNKVDRRLGEIGETLKTGFKDVIGELDVYEECVQEQLANTFERLANGLRSGNLGVKRSSEGPIDDDSSAQEDILAPPPSKKHRTKDSNLGFGERANQDAPVAPSPWHLHHKHSTLRGLYEEYTGVGSFTDPLGGIKGRDASFGPSWRKHFKPAAKQQISRTIRIAEAVERYANDGQIDLEQAVDELETVFINSCKCSLNKMVLECQERGLSPKKKSRGKSKQ